MLPLSDTEWPPEAIRLREGYAGQLNVYRVMAHHPALLLAWENLRNHVVIDNALSLEEREIVILRVGHRWQSRYEWAQHVVRGRAAGLSDARIARTAQDGGTDDDDGMLIAAVDVLLDTGMLPPARRDALLARFGTEKVFDLMATVGMYTTLAFIVKSFDTPIEPDIAAEAETFAAAQGR